MIITTLYSTFAHASVQVDATCGHTHMSCLYVMLHAVLSIYVLTAVLGRYNVGYSSSA
jgi:hypothetical protein